MRLFSVNLGGGSGGNTLANGVVAIGSGVQLLTVTFGAAVSSSAYSLRFDVENQVDANPIWLQGVITSKTTTGFTINFNAPTDSANYILNYEASSYV